jgi:SAM-dependent methyltransferase
MTQNIYDDPDFQSGYGDLPRSVDGLAGAPEWPALRALLPDLQGRRVVDLGCGYGWFCRWAREEGAAGVLGLDVSEKMLARARADTSDTAIRYARADLEAFTPAAAAFDLAYGSLAFHYIADLRRLFASIHHALVPGGRLVFSIEHPIFMAPTHPAWSAGTDGRAVWPLDGYLAEGQRVTEWFAPGVIKYHRTLGTTLNLLIGCGFSVRHVEEWGPTEAQIAAKPEWAKECERPMFLIIAAER